MVDQPHEPPRTHPVPPPRDPAHPHDPTHQPAATRGFGTGWLWAAAAAAILLLLLFFFAGTGDNVEPLPTQPPPAEAVVPDGSETGTPPPVTTDN